MASISETEARETAAKIMETAGAIPGLFQAILPAFLHGKLGNRDQLLEYCAIEPKGEALWIVYEASGIKDPYDFIVAHANSN